MVSIQGISAGKVVEWWPFVWKMVQSALDRGGDGLVGAEDILSKLLDRDLQLWVISVDGCMVASCCTEMLIWPRGKVLSAPIIAGERMDEWIAELDRLLCDFGKSNGCTHLQGHGRKGWKKTLNRLGWSDDIVEYQKRL